jgi:transcription antitermination factor NusA-like protein
MQAPICEVCLKSNILCSACQEKLNSGKISQKDVDISRYLYDLSDKMRSIRDIKILRIVDCGSLIIITGRGDAAKLVGKGGVVVKKIAKDFKKSIRILEEAPSFKDFVEELLSPAPINGINTLYKDDIEIYRIKIPAIQKNNIMITPEIFSQIISNFYKLKAEIVFEN